MVIAVEEEDLKVRVVSTCLWPQTKHAKTKLHLNHHRNIEHGQADLMKGGGLVAAAEVARCSQLRLMVVVVVVVLVVNSDGGGGGCYDFAY